ncbi:alkaline shock response membrane anchor protein AmaP [Tsukamurella asaccharolytica]|uniref:Alkaline shock response membrane anchor protein AmaP n=1 Tax=Tsukamurella asaccharolytica TaxID=2592067 RepID=A0A5C5REZ9_9ACTN|nr:alkaline shock response membrane anchor protein AmaP [Tsukamurella asaccharolytica]TWS20671.1 alkaline shock response membrane anchor protein AmaP [Tsukamurella asaccharolytica]
MKASTRVLDRGLTLLVGLLLLAGGGWLLAYRLGESTVVSATHRLRPDEIARVPEQPWWPAVVGIGGVLIVLIALWLLLRHLVTNSAKTVSATDGGTVDLDKIADAVAEDLSSNPLIVKARSTTLEHKGQPLIRVRVTAARGAPVKELAVLARSTQREVTAATNPDVGLQVVVNGEDK